MKKTEEEKREELEKEIQFVNSGSALEHVARLHNKELKKYYNKQN